MGLRSFVALPVDKGGYVSRFLYQDNLDTDQSALVTNLAYGINSKNSLLLGIPYLGLPGRENRFGDLSALLRHTLWQRDQPGATRRLALLAGALVSSHSGEDGGFQLGLVFTEYSGRNEWDIDALFVVGSGDRPNSGRYDLSWQYRLSPSRYSRWGISSQLNGVLELNGRWVDGADFIHQVTAGLQWVHPRWVLEGGLFKDMNGPEDLSALMSVRFHF
jgi:hypothetical protein